MTKDGTNTYLVGTGAVTIVDPGPLIQDHLGAILGGLAPSEHVAGILVTHAHRDHSALARPLAQATGAPVMAFGTALDGRSEIMRTLADAGLSGGGEGLDMDFMPDQRLRDGETFASLTALHTPGHAATHLCFVRGDVVFTGDTIMGWASTMVSPPDGDVADFMASVRRLSALGARMFLPGHGPPVEAPRERCDWLLDHRQAREAQILASIPPGGARVPEIARAVYPDTPPALMPAAGRNVFAHLIDLTVRKRLQAEPALSARARFRHRD